MLPGGSGIPLNRFYMMAFTPSARSVSSSSCWREEGGKQEYLWLCLSSGKQRRLSISPVECSYFSANWPPGFCWAGGVPRKVFTQLFNLWNRRGAAEEKDPGSEYWFHSQQVMTDALLKVMWSHKRSALGPGLLSSSFEIFCSDI